ncbi:hypothetical protein [Aquisediminimonas sediminicola]|uniref:hypothetical protein n=1 Tax=Alteraquisediminimonas sediminicola TaxID=2676787 RepID=UPI001C8E7570|nr:hypothetical protein [Aquisediminimonas sediminicola]
MASFFEWQSPDEMCQRVERLKIMLGNDAFQRRGRAFREAFIAARIARANGQDAVRLLPETNDEVTPDFDVRKGDHLKRYETTEADIPGRRRQLEYRDPRSSEPDLMGLTALDVMVNHIQSLARKKAAKPYRDCTGLVIYLNPPMFSFNPTFSTAHMKDATEPAAKGFEEVWLLREQATLLWKDGHFLKWMPDDI